MGPDPLHRLRAVVDAVTDLALPTACAACRRPCRPRPPLCDPCRSRLAAELWPRPRARPAGAPGVPVVAAAEYAGVLSALIPAHKDLARWDLSALLGALLTTAVVDLLDGLLDPAESNRPGVAGPILLVPVPSTRGSIRARGESPADRISRAAARQLRGVGRDPARVLPVLVVPVLERVGTSADQAGLTALARRGNLAGSMRLRGPLPAGHRGIVVIDDVVTTGATIAESCRALRSAGHRVRGAAVVASTEAATLGPGSRR